MYLLGFSFFVIGIVAYPVNEELLLPFAIIGDLDADSKVNDTWFSPMSIGTLALSANKTTAFVHWTSTHNYSSQLNHNGRGMELSDLKYFDGKLLTVDDKTGVIYWIDGEKIIPWVILNDGDGYQETLFKGEWLAVKDGYLYCGSVGKEMTTNIGQFMNDNPMFVKRVSREGEVKTENWLNRYIDLRAAIDVHFPGFVIHEAVQCSLQKWFFLPRHVSKLAYNEQSVEETGANVLLSASEDFKNIAAVPIGKEILTRGFSAFQFVPQTDDTIVAALKTEEIRGKPQSSFIMIFTITGEIILDETRIPGDYKYEGLEFLYEKSVDSLLS
ncbi:Apyrase [Ancylostoma caninum]|uniref:Apyrase n=1 Tax=Ancylostoma caninum TaxID=29170 RepID=A0A368GFX8_ANCCA|nr:Apyrase [Ancylostoma caninum]